MTKYRPVIMSPTWFRVTLYIAQKAIRSGRLRRPTTALPGWWNGLELWERGWLDAGCSCP
jgi:hypothetical protein